MSEIENTETTMAETAATAGTAGTAGPAGETGTTDTTGTASAAGTTDTTGTTPVAPAAPVAHAHMSVDDLAAHLGVGQPPNTFGAPAAMPSAIPSATPPATGATLEADSSAPKRRIRTSRLFAGALVLGVLGGVGTGYAVQAARKPTPLPSLAASQPKYLPSGVYQGLAPAVLPSSQDDATLTEGDLTKLLLPTPSGADTSNSDYVDQMISVGQDAYYCDDQVSCFTSEYSQGLEAVADTQWTTSDGFFVEIRMYRFAPGQSSEARQWETDTSEVPSGGTSISVPDGIDGAGYEYVDKWGANDDHAQAVHGDIAVSFWVSSASKVPNPSLIDSLITEQMGRL